MKTRAKGCRRWNNGGDGWKRGFRGRVRVFMLLVVFFTSPKTFLGVAIIN